MQPRPQHLSNSVRTTLVSPSRRLIRLLVALIAFVIVCAGTQGIDAQTRGSNTARLPTAEKIVDGYLKAIGGKKRIAAVRDATYEWEVRVKDQVMGIGKTQTKFPSSVLVDMTFGNGRVINAANARSAWTQGLDGKLHTLTDAESAAASPGSARRKPPR